MESTVVCRSLLSDVAQSIHVTEAPFKLQKEQLVSEGDPLKLLFAHAALLLALLGAQVGTAHAAPAAPGKIEWRPWSYEIFAQAAKEKRLILLDLEAIWCHWCHVMDERTYSDPQVIEVIRKSFIPVRVDQATRPDLADRYEDYGWPATIVIDAKGQDVWKESGFIEASTFTAELRRIVKDPSAIAAPTRQVAAAGKLSEETKSELMARHYRTLDESLGGTNSTHRFLTPVPLEYSLIKAAEGSQRDRAWAKLTLDGGLKLIDPAWGGIYQYSTDSDWDHPHFEKIMSSQVNALVLYSGGYAFFGDQRYLDAAEQVRKFFSTFLLSPEGAFYTSRHVSRDPYSGP